MNNFKKNIVNILIMITVFMSNITLVSADSGLESTYKEDGSIGAIIEAVLNLLSFLGKLITTQPSDKDYAACHAITAIICIIVFYIVTSINVFKLDKRKKNAKQNLKLLSISLIPTTIFSIFCFITKLQLILYIFITILYIIVLIIVFKYVEKNKIKKQLIEVKNIDNNFNEEEFSKEAFEIYKKVQLSWSEFKLEEVKDIISNKLFDSYNKKLDELKSKNQKNIMEDIEFKSNNIVYAKIDNDVEEIICEMNVICTDYIKEEDKVIKGDKQKKYNYLCRLYFSKNINNNKIILDNKKLLKIKINKKS